MIFITVIDFDVILIMAAGQSVHFSITELGTRDEFSPAFSKIQSMES